MDMSMMINSNNVVREGYRFTLKNQLITITSGTKLQKNYNNRGVVMMVRMIISSNQNSFFYRWIGTIKWISNQFKELMEKIELIWPVFHWDVSWNIRAKMILESNAQREYTNKSTSLCFLICFYHFAPKTRNFEENLIQTLIIGDKKTVEFSRQEVVCRIIFNTLHRWFS